MSEMWEMAKQKAQEKQKAHHDKTSRNASLKIGDRVLLFIPGLKSGSAHKLACP